VRYINQTEELDSFTQSQGCWPPQHASPLSLGISGWSLSRFRLSGINGIEFSFPNVSTNIAAAIFAVDVSGV
jgi:hypothetical protein